ncbi:MAG: cobyric acid synthase [Proteobacteria bacterium]|nr:cobyric acid synthase [Pseudomonadota bacterium]
MTKKQKLAPCIAVFGTGSDVGKSIVTTALCRYFREKGLKVAPFKAQNMSNNSGITPEGLEMGRAQIVQAEAAGIVPHVDMNPILLKPTSDVGSQVVLFGKVHENSTAMEYHKKKEALFKAATDALSRLRASNDVVVIEGAGSCAEVNLMAHDIVNFKIAHHADASVVLVADIHRGGVFGQIIGTLACLPEDCKERISGFVVNRFRGDIELFKDGVAWIEEKTGKPVFGVLPWFDHVRIEAEDSVVIEKSSLTSRKKGNRPALAVIRLPHISNFTDFDPLMGLDGLDLIFVEAPVDLTEFSGVILPGSKNTRHDLSWLKDNGWADKIKQYANQGGAVLGICGGYQMLGEKLHDLQGYEGNPGSSDGLGLLPVETTMEGNKTTTLSTFSWLGRQGMGYEIHMGQTTRKGGHALFDVEARNQIACQDEDGCVSDEFNVLGTYMHGLFDQTEITRGILSRMGLTRIDVPDLCGLAAREKEYKALLEHVMRYVDIETMAGGMNHEK